MRASWWGVMVSRVRLIVLRLGSRVSWVSLVMWLMVVPPQPKTATGLSTVTLTVSRLRGCQIRFQVLIPWVAGATARRIASRRAMICRIRRWRLSVLNSILIVVDRVDSRNGAALALPCRCRRGCPVMADKRGESRTRGHRRSSTTQVMVGPMRRGPLMHSGRELGESREMIQLLLIGERQVRN